MKGDNINAISSVQFVSLEFRAGFGSAVSDQFTGFAALKTWTHIAVSFLSTGSAITTTINYNGEQPSQTNINFPFPSTCPVMTSNFIGKGTSPFANDVNLDAYLNDIKLFNIALTYAQVQAQYVSEKCNVYILF
jgi:hypothetical protein